jgi:phosphoribosyl 1,2-cyclic phosphate phosphodiesterase
MKIKFLGTAANGGLPQLDCRCVNCVSTENGNGLSRLRSSVLVEIGDKKIILDCGPDFRQQMLKEGLRLQDIDLIVVTHLHFDHVGGLMELSTGKQLEVPILMSSKNQKLLMMRDEIKFLVGAKFAKLINEAEGRKMGVELFEIPHDPMFPTSAIIVHEDKKQVWYSSDVAEITHKMMKRMKDVSLVVFDATFLNEDVFPAKKLNHITVESSALRLATLGKMIIFSHTNHAEDLVKMRDFLCNFGFKLAKDGLSVRI